MISKMKGKLFMFLVFHTILLATSYPQGSPTKVSSITINLKPSQQPKTQRQESFDGPYRATKIYIDDAAQRGNDGRAGSIGGYGGGYAGIQGGRGSTERTYGRKGPNSGIGGSGSIKGNGGSYTGIEGGHGSLEFSYASSGAQRGSDGSAGSIGGYGGNYAGIKGGRGSAELTHGGSGPHNGIGGNGSIRGNGGSYTRIEGGHSSIEFSYVSEGAQRRNDGSAESNGGYGGAYAGIKGGRGSTELSYGGNGPYSGIQGSGSIRGSGGRYAGMEGGHGGIDISYEGNEPHRWNGHHGSNGGYGNGGAHGCKGAYPSKGVYGCNGGHGAHGSNGAYGGSDEYNGNGDHANNGGYEGGADGGCKDESGRVLRFGETYRKGNFIFKCERLSSIAVSLTPIKCILDEQDMRIGEKRRRGGFLYACLKTETGITIDVVGCFGDDDALAEFGETFTVKNFIFMCAKEGNAGIHKPYGCLIEGKQVKMGQTVQVRSFLYKCSPTRDGSVQTEVVACVDKSGRKIDIGKRYRDGPFLYQCKKTESGVRAALIGCVAKVSGFDQEFTFGESWNTDANSPLSYKMKCVGDESRAMVDITHCVANLEYAKTATPVGSHVELPKNMVHVCRRQADGQVLNRVVSCEEFEKNERQFFCRNIRS